MKKIFAFVVLAFVLFFSPSPLVYGQASRNIKVKESLDLVEAEHKKETIPTVTPAQTLENNIPEEPPKDSKAAQVTEAAKKNIFSTLQLHGYYRNRNYFDRIKDNNQEHTYELRQDLRLELSQRISDKLKYLVSLDNQYDFVHNSSNTLSPDEKKTQLWECYLDNLGDRLSLRLGRQTIRWGKGDEINPTDNFTPEDFTEFLNLDRAERKLPMWMAKADYLSGSYRVEAIWIPFFEPNRIPENGSDWEPYLLRQYHNSVFPVDVKRPQRPEQNLRSQVGAVKLTKSTSDFDLSLSYAYHYNQNPALHRNLVAVSPPPLFVPSYEVQQRFHRQQTIGSDFETVLGRFGLRGEYAYTFRDLFLTDSPAHSDTIVKKDALVGIMGADYTFKNNAYVNLQYLMQYIPEHEDGMASHQYEDSILWKISKKFLNDTLLLEWSGRLYLFNLDRYYEFKCEYAMTDSLKLAIGYDDFFGPPDALLGQYNKNDQFFAKIKYSF